MLLLQFRPRPLPYHPTLTIRVHSMIFDALVLAAVIISSVIAFLRGFIRELLTIVGVAGGLAASYFGGPLLVPVLRGWLGVSHDPAKVEKLFDAVPMNIVADVCAYGLIFVVVVIILSVLSHFLSVGAKAVGLGPVDRTLGVLFGAARAILLLSLLYLPVMLLIEKEERSTWSVLKDSRTHSYIEQGSTWISSFLPEDTRETVDDATEQANEKMNETRKRLEDMEVLKNAVDKAKETIPQEPPGAPDDATGYQSEQREKLDQLIETNQ